MSSPTAAITTTVGRAAAMGYSVAISADGTTALVGAWAANNQGGAAYIFSAASGTWTTTSATATPTNAGGAANDMFGSSVPCPRMARQR